MSTKSTVAGSGVNAELAGGTGWHVFHDFADRDPGGVWVELRGVREASVHARRGGSIAVEFSLDAQVLWELVRRVSEARGRHGARAVEADVSAASTAGVVEEPPNDGPDAEPDRDTSTAATRERPIDTSILARVIETHAAALSWALRIDGVAPVAAWAQVSDTVIEIVAEWFDLDEVPTDLTAGLRRSAAELLGVPISAVRLYSARDLPLNELTALPQHAVRLVPVAQSVGGLRPADSELSLQPAVTPEVSDPVTSAGATQPPAQLTQADAVLRMRAATDLAGHHALILAAVLDAYQTAVERGEDALHMLLLHAGVPEAEIARLAAMLRIHLGDDERAAWEWLFGAVPAGLAGTTPYSALRQGRVADVETVVQQGIDGTYI